MSSPKVSEELVQREPSPRGIDARDSGRLQNTDSVSSVDNSQERSSSKANCIIAETEELGICMSGYTENVI